MRVTKNAGSGDGNYGLAGIMKLVIAIVFSVTIALLNIANQPTEQPTLAVSETASALAPAKPEPKAQEAAAAPQPKPFDANDPTTWPTCAADQYVRADNGQCANKPKADPQAMQTVATAGGSGDCAAEIAKYDWNVSVATAVARAESGLNPGALNDNPATGDYSVGCFQVNIYGANARTRPSEAQLKNAAVNVAWAYNNYKANGHSFLGQWGVCRSKVACY
jgi:hypothetical protein